MHSLTLGCGVSGLSTAIRFLESNPANTAEIWARDLPPDTTSNIAAAIWYPYLALPYDRVLAWGKRTLDLFYDLAADPSTGITVQEAVEYFRQSTAPDPWWRSSVRQFRYLQPDEIPIAFASGYRFETVVIETSIYLPYLINRFQSLGGTVHPREITSLDQATSHSPIVFNCTGLGSRTLLNDRQMFPVRGQIVRTTKPSSPIAYLDDKEDNMGVFAYIVPRSDDCILGGTAQILERLNSHSLDPQPKIADRILKRCEFMSHEVPHLKVLEHKVGLRPGRSTVRLEAEHTPSGSLVVHNYGHSGAGVTLSWGCAEEAVSLTQS